MAFPIYEGNPYLLPVATTLAEKPGHSLQFWVSKESSVQGHRLLEFRWLRFDGPLKWVAVLPAHGIGIWQRRNTAELSLTSPLHQLGVLVFVISKLVVFI